MSSNRDNDGGGINIASSLADGQRGDYNLRQDGSVINADGTIIDDGPDDTTGDAQHSIAELQRIQADTLTDDEFDDNLSKPPNGNKKKNLKKKSSNYIVNKFFVIVES